jgi:hypothetical protein
MNFRPKRLVFRRIKSSEINYYSTLLTEYFLKGNVGVRAAVFEIRRLFNTAIIPNFKIII